MSSQINLQQQNHLGQLQLIFWGSKDNETLESSKAFL
jgi:hypothetical protein